MRDLPLFLAVGLLTLTALSSSGESRPALPEPVSPDTIEAQSPESASPSSAAAVPLFTHDARLVSSVTMDCASGSCRIAGSAPRLAPVRRVIQRLPRPGVLRAIVGRLRR